MTPMVDSNKDNMASPMSNLNKGPMTPMTPMTPADPGILPQLQYVFIIYKFC